MKIYYVTNVRFPTEKAHGWQIAKMCDAFASLGHDVTLVVPYRVTPIKEGAQSYYQLAQDFKIVKLNIWDALDVKWIPRLPAFLLTEWSFKNAVKKWSRSEPSSEALVMTRDQFLAKQLVRPGWRVAFEAHDISPRFFWLHRRLARCVDLLIASNEWKKNEMLKRWGGSIKGKVIALQNGIELKPYLEMPTKEAARNSLGLDAGRKIVLYTGHLYGWKGVYVLADASKELPQDHDVVMLGGTPEDSTRMRGYLEKNDLKKVRLIAHVPHKDVLTYLAAADCLVIPNTAKSWNSMYTTSPIKLWEYLAARRPIVASDLPSLRESVGDEEVLFVKPDNPIALARGIERACADDGGRVEKGWQRAQKQTWQARAQAIVEAIL
ncbi:MAG: glycosyltransferase [Patescibacteria group bacterium]|nr:glycosyltransferase [Patescibacteria group bacterium]